MSDGPIALLKPEDLRFVATPSDFASLIPSELGSLGTDQDGFDAAFNDAASLASTASSVLAGFDSDLNDASTVEPEFVNNDAQALASDIEPAGAAADAALAEFNGNAPPTPTDDGSGSNPTRTTDEDGFPTLPLDSDYPELARNLVFYMNAIKVGDASESLQFQAFNLPPYGSTVFSLSNLDAGDPQLGYSMQTYDGDPEHNVPGYDFLYFIVTPQTPTRVKAKYRKQDINGVGDFAIIVNILPN